MNSILKEMTVVLVLAYDIHVHVHDGVVLTSVTPHVVPLCVHVSYHYLNDNHDIPKNCSCVCSVHMHLLFPLHAHKQVRLVCKIIPTLLP